MSSGLSIVTGTLNRRGLLPLVLGNTIEAHNRIELVLVDGGSTDGTLEYLRERSCDRLKVIEIGRRSPYPHFMNAGIRASSFENVCQWNDDVLMATPWGKVFEILDEPYDVFIFHWARGNVQDAKDLNKWRTSNQQWIAYVGPDYCMNFGVYRKSVFRDIGMYSSAYQYYYADRDMTERARIFKKGIRSCPEIQVIELDTAKRAVTHDGDASILGRYVGEYRRGEIPPEVERLT